LEILHLKFQIFSVIVWDASILGVRTQTTILLALVARPPSPESWIKHWSFYIMYFCMKVIMW